MGILTYHIHLYSTLAKLPNDSNPPSLTDSKPVHQYEYMPFEYVRDIWHKEKWVKTSKSPCHLDATHFHFEAHICGYQPNFYLTNSGKMARTLRRARHGVLYCLQGFF